jgi:hypothetical protein
MTGSTSYCGVCQVDYGTQTAYMAHPCPGPGRGRR